MVDFIKDNIILRLKHNQKSFKNDTLKLHTIFKRLVLEWT